MSIEQISERIRDHLIAQRAVSTQAGFCRYRDHNGNKCAVGCLIPDSRYDGDMEGAAIYTEGHSGMLLRGVLKSEYGLDLHRGSADLALLQTWQIYHDKGDYQKWTECGKGESPYEAHERVMHNYSIYEA